MMSRTLALLWIIVYWFQPCHSFLESSPKLLTQIRSTRAWSGRTERQAKVVVIGGGWAGFSVADALSTAQGTPLEVCVLDASPRGQGGLAGGWRTAKLGRPVEAGLHGFWREYRNTFATLERIQGVDIDEVLTPYTPSILVSESGRVALAPVLGPPSKKDTISTGQIRSNSTSPTIVQNLFQPIADLLPPPLDVALMSEFSSDSPLTLADRISALGLLGAWADFGQEDKESWDRYDSISAETLFCAYAGVSPILYRELVSPLLHVLPMTPGYDCSAAAALSCFHAFALQARGAFDVRWCRGTISERIFNPWARQLQDSGAVTICGSAKVTAIASKQQTDSGSQQYEVTINDNETISCDAVVFAVGGTAMKRLLPSCLPLLANSNLARKFGKLRGVTCVAVRLFLRPDAVVTTGLKGGMYDATQLPPDLAQAMKDSPVIVCGPRIGRIPQLAESGFCIYDLQRLHDEFAVTNQNDGPTNNGGKESCAAIEVDFFRADTIANMGSDMDIANVALRAVAAALHVNEIDPERLLDVSVVRARDAVSHFSVGSASNSPMVKIEKGLYMCGDWIDRTGHASWSTEKAVVTGRQAAGELCRDFGLSCNADILAAAPDTAQLSALRKAAGVIRSVVPGIPLSPWILANRLTRGRV